jgi:hypothetical protein
MATTDPVGNFVHKAAPLVIKICLPVMYVSYLVIEHEEKKKQKWITDFSERFTNS